MSAIHTPPSLPTTTQPSSAPTFIPVINGPCHIAQVYGFAPMMPGEVLHCVGIQPGGYCSLQRIGFATMQAGVGVQQQSPPQVQNTMAQQAQMQSYPGNPPVLPTAALEAASSPSQVAPSSSAAHAGPDHITTVNIQERQPGDESDELPDEEDDHSTSRSSPQPASKKRNLNVGKRPRPSKATNDEMFRMAVHVANEGGERHGTSKWQVFRKREEVRVRSCV
ncbi:hypothetical protein PENSPDRAFT_652848 [Peniophora sp. CONT]|nr:hypothetical protein PENSPDRAFT_652848 [Peniophora sp. CONT]